MRSGVCLSEYNSSTCRLAACGTSMSSAAQSRPAGRQATATPARRRAAVVALAPSLRMSLVSGRCSLTTGPQQPLLGVRPRWRDAHVRRAWLPARVPSRLRTPGPAACRRLVLPNLHRVQPKPQEEAEQEELAKAQLLELGSRAAWSRVAKPEQRATSKNCVVRGRWCRSSPAHFLHIDTNSGALEAQLQ